MNDFLRMCFNIITQIGPYLVVLLLLKYLVNLQQKRAMSLREKEDMFVICIFGIFFLVGISGIVNMVMWKLEVNGDEITWRSTFGRKRTFHFEDITYCERKKGSMRVYVNGEKLFTIDSNIDKEEFMEDIERRRIPVKSYWANQHKKNRK